MGRPKATYAAKELREAKEREGGWCFFVYQMEKTDRDHVAKVIRWLRNHGAEVRSLDLGGSYLLAVRME